MAWWGPYIITSKAYEYLLYILLYSYSYKTYEFIYHKESYYNIYNT